MRNPFKNYYDTIKTREPQKISVNTQKFKDITVNTLGMVVIPLVQSDSIYYKINVYFAGFSWCNAVFNKWQVAFEIYSSTVRMQQDGTEKHIIPAGKYITAFLS